MGVEGERQERERELKVNGASGAASRLGGKWASLGGSAERGMDQGARLNRQVELRQGKLMGEQKAEG